MSENRANPRTQDYLEGLGLVPDQILVQGWDREGYETFNVDGTGTKIIRDGELLREWHEWPEGFDYERFEDLWWADAGTREYDNH